MSPPRGDILIIQRKTNVRLSARAQSAIHHRFLPGSRAAPGFSHGTALGGKHRKSVTERGASHTPSVMDEADPNPVCPNVLPPHGRITGIHSSKQYRGLAQVLKDHFAYPTCDQQAGKPMRYWTTDSSVLASLSR